VSAAPLVTLTIAFEGRVGPSGDAWTGPLAVDFVDPDGNPAGQGTGTFEAERIKVLPLPEGFAPTRDSTRGGGRSPETAPAAVSRGEDRPHA